MKGIGQLSLDRVRVEKRAIATSNSVTVELPFPPSVNNLFANGAGGRFRTGKYNTWRDMAGNIINTCRVRRISGPVSIRIVLEEPERRADLDNHAKALIDLLVWMNVIDADDKSTVRKVELEWGNVHGARVTVTPHEYAVRAA